jgi:hypothetical protein
MPTFLVHGFRWQRANIRIHIILHDLEDAAPEWVIAPATSVTLLNSFYSLFDFLPPSNPPPASYPLPAPTEKVIVEDDTGSRRLLKKNNSNASLNSAGRKSRAAKLVGAALGKGTNGAESGNGHHAERDKSESEASRTASGTSASRESKEKPGKKPAFNDWSVVKFVEQYDPNDLYSVSQPYAYVADYMIEVTLGASISEEVAKYEARQRKEEEPLSTPTSGTPGTPGVGASGDLTSPSLSARDIRRKSRRLGWFEKLRDQLQKGSDIGWYVVVCGDEERAHPSMEIDRTSEDSGEDQLRTPTSARLRGFFNRKKSIPEE